MLGIGWTEFIVIALVILIFVGPKHLPGMLRKFGRIVGELKSAGRELRNQIELETRDIEDIESPSQLARGIGRELSETIPSPYDEVRRAEQEAKREFAESARSKAEHQLEDAGNAKAPETKGALEPGYEPAETTSGVDGAGSDRDDAESDKPADSEKEQK